MTDLELLKKILEKPIAFHKIFFDVTQDMKTAVFLSQLYYWSEKMGSKIIKIDGKEIWEGRWFYKTAESWEEETGVNPKEQRRARKILRDKNLIQEDRRGVPATMYFKFNYNDFLSLSRKYYSQLSSLVTSERDQENQKLGSLVVTAKVPNKKGSLVTSITENNTDIKKINNKEIKKKDNLPAEIKEFELTENLIEWGSKEPQRWTVEEMKQHADFYKDYLTNVPKNKRKKDLEAQFRNCVRGNWAKVRQSFGNTFKTKRDLISERNDRVIDNFFNSLGEGNAEDSNLIGSY